MIENDKLVPLLSSKYELIKSGCSGRWNVAVAVALYIGEVVELFYVSRRSHLRQLSAA